jgi:hypothetical protein
LGEGGSGSVAAREARPGTGLQVGPRKCRPASRRHGRPVFAVGYETCASNKILLADKSARLLLSDYDVCIGMGEGGQGPYARAPSPKVTPDARPAGVSRPASPSSCHDLTSSPGANSDATSGRGRPETDRFMLDLNGERIRDSPDSSGPRIRDRRRGDGFKGRGNEDGGSAEE